VALYRASAFLLLAVAGCAPQSERKMDVLGVSPSRVSSLQATPATISGENFWNRVRASVNNSSAPEIRRGWYFTIPGTLAVDQPATRVDESTLAIVVPRGLPVGQHDLTITSPSGRTDGLENALTVVAGDVGEGGAGGARSGGAAGAAGLAVSSPGGGGAAGGTLAAGGAAGKGSGGAPAGAAGAGGAALGGAGGDPTALGGSTGVAGGDAGGAAGAAGAEVAGGAGGTAGAVVGGTAGAGTAGAAGTSAGGEAGQLDATGGAAGALGVVTFEPPAVIGALMDTRSFEDDPTFTDDLLELVFNTDRDTTAPGDDSLWVSTRATPSDRWGPPHAIDELNTSGYQDTTPGIEGDGLTIWFASTRPGGGGTQYDIWKSTRADRNSVWATPTAVTELNTAAQEVAPQVIQSGLFMVVETNQPGGAGGHDLYQTSRATVTDPWGPIEPVPGVNTAANEYAGRFVLGGLGIVFCSDRDRLNGQDIFYAERASLSEAFSTAQPLGGVNTNADDFDPWPSEDLSYIVFASDRSGNAEIYEAWR
jgi:hypothetical protein